METDNSFIHRLVILALGILLLAFVDVIVLERIYKPISQNYAVPWKAFEVQLPLYWRTGTGMLWWHVAFMPLGVAVFALLGISGRDWRLAVTGIVLIGTGWEDIIYYFIQAKWIPYQLPWLDGNLLMSLVRVFTGSTHVTRIDLFISATTGAVVTGWILGFDQALRNRKDWNSHSVRRKFSRIDVSKR